MTTMTYDLNVIIECRLCGRLCQAHVLDHEPTDEELAEFSKEANEDHQKLHELREIESSFEKLDEE